MKKFLIAAAASVLLFGGQAGSAEASTVDSLNVQSVETQEMGKWKHFRDKYLLDREDRHRHRHRRDYDYPPPPPPPPPPRPGRHYGPPPPPPPPPRPGRNYGPPPPPPPPGWGAPPPPPRR